jgi:hypothetical protein
MTVFNQLVQQQTDFIAMHAAEIRGHRDKEALATAADVISQHLHEGGIGDAEWYRELIHALDANIDQLASALKAKKQRRPWQKARRRQAVA